MMQTEKVIKFIERKASPQEQKEVMEWLEASPENRKEFARLKNLSVAVDLLAMERKKPVVASRKNILMWSMRVAAALVVALSAYLLGEAAQEHRWKSAASGQFTEIVAPEGEVLHFNLPDGSKVALNGGSTIRFSQLFNGQTRDVYLSGEGYFEVKKDKKSFNVVYPIDDPKLKLTVLGTKFNISSYEGKEDIVTSLYEGSVAIEDLGSNESFELKPNDRLVFEKTTGESVVEQFTETYKWTDKYIVANDEDISVLAKRLEDIFGVTILLDEALVGSCSYSGALLGSSLQQILENMTYVSSIKYSIDQNSGTVIIERR